MWLRIKVSEGMHQSKFDNVEFHDGIINAVSVSVLKQFCEINLCLGDYKSGRARSASLLSCKGLESFFGRFGSLELAENAGAGNVQDGRVDVPSGSLRLSLAGVIVEAAGAGVDLDALNEPVDRGVAPKVRVGSSGFALIENADFLFARLESVHFGLATDTCVINLLMSAGGNPSDLYPVRMSFSRVTSSLAKLDLSGLARERKFGNVLSCTVSRKENMTRMYLSDGFIEVVARRASLARR